ncbi:MAG: hypothetical protein QM764_02145 [Chitinophagaceae bacterium]
MKYSTQCNVDRPVSIETQSSVVISIQFNNCLSSMSCCRGTIELADLFFACIALYPGSSKNIVGQEAVSVSSPVTGGWLQEYAAQPSCFINNYCI